MRRIVMAVCGATVQVLCRAYRPLCVIRRLAGSIAADCDRPGLIVATRGLPSRLSPAAARINAAVGTNYRCAVSDYLYLSQSRACVLELPSRNPQDADVVLLGNSHAQMYAPIFGNILHGLALHGLLVPANGCLPTYGSNISPACQELADRNIDAVGQLRRVRVVVIGTTWNDRLADGAAGTNPVNYCGCRLGCEPLIGCWPSGNTSC